MTGVQTCALPICFDGIAYYPELLRRLSDLEAENSYSAYAILVTVGLAPTVARVVVVVAAVALLVLAWRAGRAGLDGLVIRLDATAWLTR